MNTHDPCSVLVVEDDASIADFVQSVLGDEGYRVRLASSGEDALQSVAEARPGVILLDLLLPGMDGRTFLRELRQRQGAGIPVIVMTAAREDIDQGEGLVVEGRLLKPFDLGDLVAEVRRLTGDQVCQP